MVLSDLLIKNGRIEQFTSKCLRFLSPFWIIYESENRLLSFKFIELHVLGFANFVMANSPNVILLLKVMSSVYSTNLYLIPCFFFPAFMNSFKDLKYLNFSMLRNTVQSTVDRVIWVSERVNLADPCTKRDSHLVETLKLILYTGRIHVDLADDETCSTNRPLGKRQHKRGWIRKFDSSIMHIISQ